MCMRMLIFLRLVWKNCLLVFQERTFCYGQCPLLLSFWSFCGYWQALPIYTISRWSSALSHFFLTIFTDISAGNGWKKGNPINFARRQILMGRLCFIISCFYEYFNHLHDFYARMHSRIFILNGEGKCDEVAQVLFEEGRARFWDFSPCTLFKISQFF